MERIEVGKIFILIFPIFLIIRMNLKFLCKPYYNISLLFVIIKSTKVIKNYIIWINFYFFRLWLTSSDNTKTNQYISNKKIAGAALDVFEEPPIQKDNPLLKFDNVIISPHNGGMSPKSVKKSFEMSLEEMTRIASGKAPQNKVN